MAENGDLEINQVIIRQDTFLNSVELLLGDNTTIDKKNEVLANIFALQIIEIAENPDLVYKLVNRGREILASKEIDIESSVTQMTYDVGGVEADAEDIPELKLFPVVDPNVVSSSSYPVVTLSVQDFVASSSEIERTMDIDFSNAQDLERLVICIPRGATRIEGSKDFAKTFIGGDLCISLDTTDLQMLSLNYAFEPLVETQGDNAYNIRSAILNTPGLIISYDVEISSVGYELSSTGELISSSGKLVSSGELAEDKIINFIIRK